MLETKYFLILVVPKVDVIEWDRAYNKRIVYIYIDLYTYTYTYLSSILASRENHTWYLIMYVALQNPRSVSVLRTHVFFFFLLKCI